MWVKRPSPAPDGNKDSRGHLKQHIREGGDFASKDIDSQTY